MENDQDDRLGPGPCHTPDDFRRPLPDDGAHPQAIPAGGLLLPREDGGRRALALPLPSLSDSHSRRLHSPGAYSDPYRHQENPSPTSLAAPSLSFSSATQSPSIPANTVLRPQLYQGRQSHYPQVRTYDARDPSSHSMHPPSPLLREGSYPRPPAAQALEGPTVHDAWIHASTATNTARSQPHARYPDGEQPAGLLSYSASSPSSGYPPQKRQSAPQLGPSHVSFRTSSHAQDIRQDVGHPNPSAYVPYQHPHHQDDVHNEQQQQQQPREGELGYGRRERDGYQCYQSYYGDRSDRPQSDTVHREEYRQETDQHQPAWQQPPQLRQHHQMEQRQQDQFYPRQHEQLRSDLWQHEQYQSLQSQPRHSEPTHRESWRHERSQSRPQPQEQVELQSRLHEPMRSQSWQQEHPQFQSRQLEHLPPQSRQHDQTQHEPPQNPPLHQHQQRDQRFHYQQPQHYQNQQWHRNVEHSHFGATSSRSRDAQPALPQQQVEQPQVRHSEQHRMRQQQEYQQQMQYPQLHQHPEHESHQKQSQSRFMRHLNDPPPPQRTASPQQPRAHSRYTIDIPKPQSHADQLYEGTSSTAQPFNAWTVPDESPSSSIPDTPTSVTAAVESASSALSSKKPKLITRRKKTSLEEEGYCCRCGVYMGTLIFHGPPAHVTVPHVAELRCMKCEFGDSVAHETAAAAPTRRRRKRVQTYGPGAELDCDVCMRRVGSGGVRAPFPDEDISDEGRSLRANDRMKSGPDYPSYTQEWVELNFDVEVVCALCKAKYSLCTECGGGGTFRTGKWRPIELFPVGRKTCSLSHLRVGPGAPIDIYCWQFPQEAYTRGPNGPIAPRPDTIANILAEVREVYEDGYLTNLALPSVMESLPVCQNWELLTGRFVRAWREAETVLTTSIPGSRIFLAVAWMRVAASGRHRGGKKGKASHHGAGISGVQGATESTRAGSVNASPQPQGGGLARDPARMMVSFMSVHWKVHDGSILLIPSADRGSDPTPNGITAELLRRIIARIKNDAIAENLPEVKHMWCYMRNFQLSTLNSERGEMVPRSSSSSTTPGGSGGSGGTWRAAGILGRLGMVPLTQYIRSHPDVNRNLFETSVPEEMRPFFAPFLTSMDDVNQMLIPRPRRPRRGRASAATSTKDTPTDTPEASGPGTPYLGAAANE